MKHGWLVLVALSSALAAAWLAAAPRAVHAESGPASEPYSGQALCLPDAYLSAPGNCLPLGPSQTLTALAQKGLTFPPRPLPAAKPSSDLTKSPVDVARINVDKTEPAKIYATLEDAASGNNPVRSIAAGAGLLPNPAGKPPGFL